jgi:hypothetical protein
MVRKCYSVRFSSPLTNFYRLDLHNKTCVAFITLFKCMVLFHSIFSMVDMGLHYLTFMGRNLRNKKKLMSVQIMNTADVNNKNVVKNVAMNSIFNG